MNLLQDLDLHRAFASCDIRANVFVHVNFQLYAAPPPYFSIMMREESTALLSR